MTKLEEFGAVQSLKALEVSTKLVGVEVGTTHSATYADISIMVGLTREVSGISLKQHLTNIWQGAFKKT